MCVINNFVDIVVAFPPLRLKFSQKERFKMPLYLLQMLNLSMYQLLKKQKQRRFGHLIHIF